MISRAAPVPSLQHSESETASLIDVDSPHVSSVRSDFEEQAVKTETQAARLEHEAEDKARAKAAKAEEAAKEAREKAEEKAARAKAAAKKEAQKLKENRDNPVYVANTLIWGIGAIALAVGAYQKHTEGKLDAKLVGTTAAAVGAFAVADYFGSQYVHVQMRN